MRRLVFLSHFVHDYFIWLLFGSYALAALWPNLGLAVRNISFGEFAVFREKTKLTLPVVMLAFLLLNAGLGVQTGELTTLLRQPLVLSAGLAANLLALGIVARRTVGDAGITSAGPFLRLLNSINLLLLNYANAAVSLPQMIADPDWDFLAVVLIIVLGLCVLAFAAGWLLGRWLKVDPPQQVSLTFGLGMNNNGTGLVLASLALANHPRVLLPIIFYNLVQHFVAGCVDFINSTAAGRRQSRDPTASASA